MEMRRYVNRVDARRGGEIDFVDTIFPLFLFFLSFFLSLAVFVD